ncbi:hypothetical protein E2C01_090016 [Portunus trituberculatus]|uniref:Uncharacterized protein n=1 Tax=Portunus trituberculatus TaxID=210409 RepID=A0A5B7JDK9_PORTR|nr:hypothetical protein [Portunus trituberculatus]
MFSPNSPPHSPSRCWSPLHSSPTNASQPHSLPTESTQHPSHLCETPAPCLYFLQGSIELVTRSFNGAFYRSGEI